MLDFWADKLSLTLEQLRSKDRDLRQELEDIDKRITKNPKAANAATMERISHITAWLDTTSAPADQAGHSTMDGGFHTGETGAESRDKNLAFGQYLQAVCASSAPSGQRYGMFDGGRVYRNILEPEARSTGLNKSQRSTGGFLVGVDMSREIFSKAHQTSKIWSRIRTIPISGNSNGLKLNTVDESSRADGSRIGGVRGYWIGEGSEKTASKPKFGQFQLSLKKLVVLIWTTDELLQDAAALGEFISTAASQEIGFKLDDGVINGTGAGQLLGLLNADALIAVSKESGQLADTIIYDNILQMVSQFWAAGFDNAVWLANQIIIPQLYAMNLAVGTAAVPVYSPANGSIGSKASLFVRPILFVEQAASLGDRGAIILADLSQYVGITKGGIQSAVSMHVSSAFVNDEQVFRFVFRCDGQPAWSSSLAPYKGSDSIGPYVTIEERT